MKYLVILLCLACLALPAIAQTRVLTDTEKTAVNDFLATQEVQQRKAYGSNYTNGASHDRNPYFVCSHYERNERNGLKFEEYPALRWGERPVFPGWEDKCYEWHPEGKTAFDQLYCSKCDKFVLPDGRDCGQKHPLPALEAWTFTVNLVADTYGKPLEAKAHLWNALEHKEISDADWQTLMAQVDAIEAKTAQAAADKQ